jgi:elongation factor Ts
MISANDVAKLRDMTGAGMMDAKKALTETNGDFDQAVEWLRKSGALKVAKKADRATAEGRVHTYTHSNGKLAVMVEVMCETDFVSRNQDFIDFCQDLAMHIAAAAPQYLSREDVPSEVIEKEKAFHTEQLQAEGKTGDVVEKIMAGKLDKFFEDIVLMEQKFVKDDEVTIATLLAQTVTKLGENIKLGRFVRMTLGG